MSFTDFLLNYISENLREKERALDVENEPERQALIQLKRKQYYEKYIHRYPEIYLIGVEFSKKQRNVVGFEVERLF